MPELVSTHKKKCRARLIAFYLPQFHPIQENDTWWGKGFTEWTNTQKAHPLFDGHYQPHIPADLGYYDLFDLKIRKAQAEMALEYGIEGFCYWHYWFSGKQLLEKPLEGVLKTGEPNLPFCMGWANESWTGVWHGCPRRILIKQEYPGKKDEVAHFYSLLNAFKDRRYITVNGCQLFYISQPSKIPHIKRFIEHWRELAAKEGLKGIYFVGSKRSINETPNEYGLDAMVPNDPGFTFRYGLKLYNTLGYLCNRLSLECFSTSVKELISSRFSKPYVIDYKRYVDHSLSQMHRAEGEFPCVVPNWDNSPRCGVNGIVLHESSPELFRKHLRNAVDFVGNNDIENRIVFVKSWNEWGEGNYLEPDQKFGRRYLEVCRDEIYKK